MSANGAEKEEDLMVSDDTNQADSDAKTEVAEEVAKQHRMIKDLGARELTFLRKLQSDYPGFAKLNTGDQLDRMILVLQSACGYGAVSERIVQQIQQQLNWGKDFDIDNHFRSSKYESKEASATLTRYRESFEGAFALKREYMTELANEGEDQDSEEPIRKRVAKKAPTPTDDSHLKTKPVNQKTEPHAVAQPEVQAVASNEGKMALPDEPAQASVTPIRENIEISKASEGVESENKKAISESETASSGSATIPLWMIVAGLSVVILIVLISLLSFG